MSGGLPADHDWHRWELPPLAIEPVAPVPRPLWFFRGNGDPSDHYR